MRGGGGRRRAVGMPLLGVISIVAVAVLVLVALRRGEESGSPGATATATPPAAGRESARVLRVIDGDTILVELSGRQERVRYIGVDTPETVAPDRPPGCFGEEASRANKDLVEGKAVQMERDVSERDRFDRLLRYVYVDGAFVNEELIRQGFGTVVSFPPDVRENGRFRAVEREAREARRGLWGACRG